MTVFPALGMRPPSEPPGPGPQQVTSGWGFPKGGAFALPRAQPPRTPPAACDLGWSLPVAPHSVPSQDPAVLQTARSPGLPQQDSGALGPRDPPRPSGSQPDVGMKGVRVMGEGRGFPRCEGNLTEVGSGPGLRHRSPSPGSPATVRCQTEILRDRDKRKDVMQGEKTPSRTRMSRVPAPHG